MARAASRTAALITFAAALLFAAGSLAVAADLPTIRNFGDVSKLFESNSTVTEYGVVLEVARVPYSRANPEGATATVLKLASIEGERLAYMGPSNFLDRAGVIFVPGESLILKGVKARKDGEEWLVSRVFSKSDGAMVVRGPGGNLGGSLLNDSLACAENVVLLCSR